MGHNSKRALLALVALIVFLPAANASFLPGTTLIGLGQNGVFPGNVTGVAAGTSLVSVVSPYSFTTPATATMPAGVTSGTLSSQVFRNSSGTLDFYYQVSNAAGSSTAIARNSDANFAGFNTQVGIRTDAVGIFAAATQAPSPLLAADRNAAGSVVGFQFNPPDTAKIAAGKISTVLVISTDATTFIVGQASIIDGGTATVPAFEPGGTVPEPMSLMLMGGGLLALAGFRRFKKAA